MSRAYPTDPAQLSRWLRTPRREPHPIEDAYAIIHCKHAVNKLTRAVLSFGAVLFAALLLFHLYMRYVP